VAKHVALPGPYSKWTAYLGSNWPYVRPMDHHFDPFKKLKK